MPKVLHVISGLKVGGAEMFLHRLILNSRGGKFTHAVVALHTEGEMRQRFIDAGIELVVLDLRRSPVLDFFRLISLIRKKRPDIVQTWMYHADLLGGVAARLASNSNVIWGVRGSAIPQSGISTTGMFVTFCSWASYFLPRVIVCCAESARIAHVKKGYDQSKMIVIPNGYELSHFNKDPVFRQKARALFGFYDNEMVIGIVGRFDPLKDYKNFVRAATIVGSKFNHVKFLMIGREIDSKNYVLKGWLDRSRIVHKFVLAGERSNIPEFLAAMDIFCLSSSKEGFPNVVCEAMAMNIPCVVTDAGDATEIVSDTGMVVSTCDPIALAGALQTMISKDIVERSQLGERARLRIEKYYSIDIASARFENVYNKVIKNIPLGVRRK